MTAYEYQQKALKTLMPKGVFKSRDNVLTEGLIGLSSEAGECLDELKKYLYQGHDLNKGQLAKELGDVAWYLAISAWALGFDLEKIFDINIEKLKVRYPEGFDYGLSINRKDTDV